MIIMGIDASTTSTGWAIFDDKELKAYGLIKPNGEDWRERIGNQSPQLVEIISKYKPEKIYMEDVPLKSKYPKVLVQLGAVQGFIYGVTASVHVPVVFLGPSEWRSPMGLFNGTREGTKRDELKKKSIEKANKLFGLDLLWVSPKSTKNEDDIADAVLIAYSQIKVKHIGRR